jgi:CheY-like chemotaxis protein
VNLYLPRADAADTDIAEPEATQPVGKRDLRGSERILVVEDDATLREVPVAMLRRHGYDIVEAADGAQAVTALEADGNFDLLFTDVVLPGGMSGVDIAAAAERLQPGIKVLYTSGYTENAVVHNGRLDPGVNLLTKPYGSDRLLEMVRAVLDGD